jgi:UDP-glucuronate 4-epimerase
MNQELRTNNHSPGTILVTGGAGFIGSHLCERLLQEGYRGLCLDNFNDFYDPKIKERNIAQARNHPNFSLIRGDILDTKLLEKIFSGQAFEPNKPYEPNKLNEPLPREISTIGLFHRGYEPYELNELNRLNKPDVVIHLAALAGVRPSIVSPTKYVDIDIKGTVNLLEMVKKYQVKQFIFGSSSSVYGSNSKIPFSEKDPTEQQVSPYATAKKAGELYCKTYHHLYGIPTTILRFFTVYGPRQRPEMAIHKFTRLMKRGEPVPMYGDGTSARDYTYIDDIIDGIMAAIERPFGFEIFNLGNSETINLRDLIDLIGSKLDIRPRIDQQPEQPGDVPITYADISKASELLHYNPEVSVEEGLEKFVEWYQNTKSIYQRKDLI